MTDQDKLEEKKHRGGAIWLVACVWIAAMSLFRTQTPVQVLFAASFVLMGVFAYFNNPLLLAQRPTESLTVVHTLALVCGFFGALGIMGAAWLKLS